MSKAASLTSGLVAKKGQAMPATPSPALPSTPVLPKAPQVAATDYYKALTVKLDRDRYETLKNAGVKLDKKSQEIFVEALDLWLKQAAPQSA
jgi:hypothetical protein